MSLNGYIAVHGGAGLHGYTHECEVKQALRRACGQALRTLAAQGTSSLEMVEDAIVVLEDEPHLNAGYGSNLTLDGTVECDAAIMGGRSSHFGSVGAVSGVKNPIRLARSILDHSQIPDALGRIPPMTLVSDGAHAFAHSRPEKVQTVAPDSLISPGAKDQWLRWKRRLETPGAADDGMVGGLSDIQDTVGAVAWHSIHGMSAGVSSGGILLKYAGRIGEAATFGAGCWAHHSEATDQGMACSVSGAGEHIVRAMLARAIGDALSTDGPNSGDIDIHEALHRVLVNGFWQPCRERGEREPNAGVLLLTTEDDGRGWTNARLWCAFTTPSMAIAYASSKDPNPKAVILRRPKSKQSRSGEEPRIYITSISL